MNKSHPDNVVFLDMDGVLTQYMQMFFEKPPADKLHYGTRYIDKSRGQMFANFVNDNGLSVVLSSTWRKRNDIQFNPQNFSALFTKQTGATIPVVGCTEDLNTVRGVEIKKYVEQHSITNYVILDDDTDMLPEQMTRFVNVNHLNGLTMTDLIVASNMLHLDNELSKLCQYIKWHQAYKYYRPERGITV